MPVIRNTFIRVKPPIKKKLWQWFCAMKHLLISKKTRATSFSWHWSTTNALECEKSVKPTAIEAAERKHNTTQYGQADTLLYSILLNKGNTIDIPKVYRTTWQMVKHLKKSINQNWIYHLLGYVKWACLHTVEHITSNSTYLSWRAHE